MQCTDWTPPNCPACQADSMVHKCVSNAPGTAGFQKNGWYCESCNSGPFRLGKVTEADAARLALRLINSAQSAQQVVEVMNRKMVD